MVSRREWGGTLVGVAVAAVCLSGCGSGDRSGQLDVVCTTGMVADLVRHVGGERVKVTQIMGEGVDPHRYQASPGDVNQLSRADVIFYSGLHLEGKMSD